MGPPFALVSTVSRSQPSLVSLCLAISATQREGRLREFIEGAVLAGRRVKVGRTTAKKGRPLPVSSLYDLT